MRVSGIYRSAWPLCCNLALLLSLLVLSQAIQAQCAGGVCPGDNAVHSSNGQNPQVQSHSFIDASQIAGNDLCTVINTALQQLQQNPQYYGHSEGVIDARGVSPTVLNGICSSSPWSGLAHSVNSTVLLPAGTIKTSATWVVPAFTKLVGQGACSPGSGSCSTLTTIQATTSLAYMIQMGDHDPSKGNNGACPQGLCVTTRYNCNGVGIEHLRLDGNNNTGIGGILNEYSEELSYVNDVAMVNLQGTGLEIESVSDGDADNSGPYSNLYISTAKSCAQIAEGMNTTNPMTQTRGIHGLTCNTQLTSGAAISIDTINNTIEDVSVTGTSSLDGIELGENGNASGNIVMNVAGTSLAKVIHIWDPGSTGTCPGNHNVCDLTIAGVSAGTGTKTIEDDLPGGSTLSNSTVGLYVVGEPVGAATGKPGGTSRFTTSRTVPTWLVGTQLPSGPSCTVGDLYSYTSAPSTVSALYACTNANGTWSAIATH